MDIPTAQLRMQLSPLDARTLADAIWLAAARYNDGAVPGEMSTGPGPAPDPPSAGSPTDHTKVGADRSVTSEQPGAVRKPLPSGPRGATVTLAKAQLRADRRMPGALEIARSLRPFKRQWPAGTRYEFDLEKTLATYEHTKRVIPAFRPAPERWFEVVLVADQSPSMRIWNDTIAEFADVLHRLAAFRQVRTDRLTFVDGEPRLTTAGGRSTGAGQVRTAMGSRRLILVFTDGMAPEWSQQPAWDLIRRWAATNVTTIVSPFSARLWLHTGLDQPAVTVTSPAGRTAAGIQWHHHRPAVLPKAAPGRGWTPVPAVALAPHSLGRWARTLMRNDPAGCDALLVSPGRTASPEPEIGPRPTPTQIVTSFLHVASPSAVRLAVLCSPYDDDLDMAVVQFILRELLPETDIGSVAEMMLGGLLAVDDPGPGSLPTSPPRLRFRNGVGQVLRSRLTQHDAWTLFSRIARHAEKQEDRSGGTTVLFPGPRGTIEVPEALNGLTRMASSLLLLLRLNRNDREDNENPPGGEPGAPSEQPTELTPRWSTWPLDGTSLVSGEGPGEVRSVSVVASGRRPAVIAGNGHRIQVWSADDGERIDASSEYAEPVRMVAAADFDGSPIVAAVASGGHIQVWWPERPDSGRTIDSSVRGTITALALGVFEGRPMVVSADRQVRVWDALTTQMLGALPTTALTVAMTEVAGRCMVFAGGSDSSLSAWDLARATAVWTGKGHRGPVRSVAVGTIDDTDVIVSGGSDKVIRVWHVDTGELRAVLSGPAQPITSVAIGRLGRRQVVVSGCHDGTIRIWDGASGDQLHVVDLHTPVHSVAIGAGHIVTGTDRGLVCFTHSGQVSGGGSTNV